MNKIPSIKFSAEWDKLKVENRKEGSEFTTLRGYDPRKESYYISITNSIMNVEIKGSKIGSAILEELDITRPSELGIEFLRKDTKKEWNIEDIRSFFSKMYRNPDPICIVLHLRWIKVA